MESFTLIGDYLRHWSKERPDTEALVWNNTRLTYHHYQDQVSACVKGLLGIGIKRGDRVAVLSPPRPEVMILYVAISEIGAIFVGLNYKGTLNEFNYATNDARPVAIFSAISHADRHYGEDIRELLRANKYIEQAITFDGAISDTTHAYQDFIEKGKLLQEDLVIESRSLVDQDDPAVIVYTSGSTGKPKGALVTHRSVLAGMGAQADRFRNVKPVRVMFPVPIHHLGSVGNVGTSTLILGGAIIFVDQFSPKGSLELISKEKITLWAQVPTMFLMQLAVPDFEKFDLSCVQAIFFAGSAIPREAVVQLAKTGADLCTGYGLTETSGPVTLSDLGASAEDMSDTIGKPVPGVELIIADDDGNPLPVGQAGEIWVRGDCIFKGYFNRPDATSAATDADGWFKSGDLAIADESRSIRIIGRKQEVFKSGGSNVYPREIEEVLQSHPGIAIACVVSVQHPIYQEVGYAFVVPHSGVRLDEESLKNFCNEKLAKYKVPRRFDIRDSLPTIGIGKVDRAWMKKEALSVIGES